jgi:hypothetical protein
VAEEVRVLAQRVSVERHVQHVPTPPEDLLRPVPVMEVDVEDRDPVAGGSRDRFRGDRGVVVEAVAAGHRARRMVTGRPAQAVRDRFAAHHEVHRRQRDVDGSASRASRSRDERVRRIQAPPARPSRG